MKCVIIWSYFTCLKLDSCLLGWQSLLIIGQIQFVSVLFGMFISLVLGWKPQSEGELYWISSEACTVLNLLYTLKSQDLLLTTIFIFTSFSSLLRKFLTLVIHITGIIFCKIFLLFYLPSLVGFSFSTTFGISLHSYSSQLLLAAPVS